MVINLKTVKKGSIGQDVYVLQAVLRAIGILGKNGKPLAIDGHCGDNLIYAINQFQKIQNAYGNTAVGKQDSSCGSKMWACLLGGDH